MSSEREGMARGHSDVVVPLASVPDGRGLVVRVNERLRVAIFRVRDALYAIDDVCPHQGASLGGGALAGTVVACPRHGFLVDVTSGRCPNNPLLRVRTFTTQREGDTVRVIVPSRSC